MDATDCDALVADILALRDDPATRRLILDAWGAPDRPLALRAALSGVRDYVAHERSLAGIGANGGEVRGPCERPVGVACWWLGAREGKTKTTPAMGSVAGGERLPKEAKYWAVESQGYWFRLPTNGG